MSVTTSSINVYGSPAYVAVGVAPAISVDLGIIPRVEITLDLFMQAQQNEIGQIMGDSPLGSLKGGQCVLTLMKNSAVQMAALLSGIETDETTSKSFKEDPLVMVPITIAVMPRVGYGQGETYAGLKVCTAAVAREISAFIHKVEESTESSETFQITFDLTRITTDADSTPQAINEGYQIYFEGSMEDALGGSPTTPWALPAGY